jgi:hypothetical protein
MRLFVYGTLCDAEVRGLVMGGQCGDALPATLRGYVAVRVIGAKYPALRRQPAGCVAGFILSGFDFATLTRISHYESIEYRVVHRQPVVFGHGPLDALLFLARRNVALSQRLWTLKEWQYRHKRRELPRIESWMARWRPDNPIDAQGLRFACRQIERAGEFDLRQVSD